MIENTMISLENNLQTDFFFQETRIKVKILKHIPKINLLTSVLGPFKNGSIINVKIWIAGILEESNLCRIIKPGWLREDWLEKKLLLEKKSSLLQHLPFNYTEICHIFLKNKNIENGFLLKELSLIEEIFSIRSLKLWNGIKIIRNNVNALKFDKICSMEFINLKKIIQFFLYFLGLL